MASEYPPMAPKGPWAPLPWALGPEALRAGGLGKQGTKNFGATIIRREEVRLFSGFVRAVPVSRFGNRRGSGRGLGTENIDFPSGKYTFLTAPVVGDKSVQMHWKRKTLIFLQENVHFWKQKRVWMWLGNAKY